MSNWNYIVPVKLPADLKGVEPGKLPAHLLKPAHGGGKLHWLCAAAWNAMVEKAKAEGMELKPTSSGDTYRDYESQKRGFLTRYTTQNNGSKTTRTFEGKTWYLLPGKAPMATPGKSNHNLGLAVDVHTASGKRLDWMIANVKEFGFSWEVHPVEPWHIRLVTGDSPTPAVRAYMEKNGIVPPKATDAPAPAPTPVSNTKGGDLKRGSSGPEVVALQNKLKEAGFYSARADGDFGPKTEEALKNFQRANGLRADGVAGPKTKAKLGL